MDQISQQILTKLNDIEAKMVTKDEFNKVLGTLATKEEVSKLATKEEVSKLATDIFDLRTEMINGFARVDKKLNTISEQVAYNTEQELRITKLETDVRIIKKAISNI